MHTSREGFCCMLEARIPGNGVICFSGKRETGGGASGIDEGSGSTGITCVYISRGLGGEAELAMRGDVCALDGAYISRGLGGEAELAMRGDVCALDGRKQDGLEVRRIEQVDDHGIPEIAQIDDPACVQVLLDVAGHPCGHLRSVAGVKQKVDEETRWALRQGYAEKMHQKRNYRKDAELETPERR
ncbi:hypothetical protein GUITHDRAFT_116988 [Guillardia theta CCMP2712]|uniref:Uncharacterized protein n=1 Tax=Guillardia theta (strain CCMP2712) TaxID=905079 RepID=L1IL37_GUITC|nr:hypothetical protein GUITHDRAFT_116988 [Guillardia theta CCMP2712]EKX36822.1 hypothetical protein GUITHDRAFT_116988 [Guillardia theta CCMP2712]|eukprot:XP_005823802.1 hypothetical protein GUITHDRAFT_116988 [Guillardia theta CCMP2712]